MALAETLAIAADFAGSQFAVAALAVVAEIGLNLPPHRRARSF